MTWTALEFSLPAAARDNGLIWNKTALGDQVRKSLETGIADIAEACNPGGHHEISTELRVHEEMLHFLVSVSDRQQTCIDATESMSTILLAMIRGADYVGAYRARGMVPLIRWEQSESIGIEDREGAITLRAPLKVSGGMVHLANFFLAMDYENKGRVSVRVDGETIDVRVAKEPMESEPPATVTFTARVNAVDDRAKTGHFIGKGSSRLLALPDALRDDALNAQLQRKQVRIVAEITSSGKGAQRVTGRVVKLSLVGTDEAIDKHESLQIHFEDPKKPKRPSKGRARRR